MQTLPSRNSWFEMQDRSQVIPDFPIWSKSMDTRTMSGQKSGSGKTILVTEKKVLVQKSFFLMLRYVCYKVLPASKSDLWVLKLALILGTMFLPHLPIQSYTYGRGKMFFIFQFGRKFMLWICSNQVKIFLSTLKKLATRWTHVLI